jgi:hypothetical protein
MVTIQSVAREDNPRRTTKAGMAPANSSRRGLNLYIVAITAAAICLAGLLGVYRPISPLIDPILPVAFHNNRDCGNLPGSRRPKNQG